MKTKLFTQFRILLPTFVVLYGLAALILLATVAISIWTQVPLEKLTRDPTAIAHISPFTGMLSSLGILFWCAPTVVCLFSAALLWKEGRNRDFLFLFLFAGLITLILLLDDLFLIHEELFPTYTGFDETKLFVVYVAAILVFLFRFRAAILRTDFLLLLFACGFFASAILLDAIADVVSVSSKLNFFEDGLKLLGIASWAGYFVRTCFQKLIWVEAG